MNKVSAAIVAVVAGLALSVAIVGCSNSSGNSTPKAGTDKMDKMSGDKMNSGKMDDKMSGDGKMEGKMSGDKMADKMSGEKK